MAAEIYLVRHGETAWNLERRYQGQRDSPLTPRGLEHARQAGLCLARATAHHRGLRMLVSPLGRTWRTAAIMRSAHDLPPPEPEPRLQEISMGAWEGLTRAEAEAGWPVLFQGASRHNWVFRAPGGESHGAALARVHAWLGTLGGPEGRPVVAVSHGLLGRLIRGAWLGLAPEAALALPVPHDIIWHLRAGEVQALPY